MKITDLPRIARADSATWGQTLETTARSAAAVLVAVYVAGLVLGAWVHRLNGALGAIASRPHRPALPQQPAAAPARRRSHRPAPMPAKAAEESLQLLTVRQLRQLAREAGHKGLARNGRRAELLAAFAA